MNASYLTCRKCKQSNLPGAEFCEACGKKLTAGRYTFKQLEDMNADMLRGEVGSARTGILVAAGGSALSCLLLILQAGTAWGDVLVYAIDPLLYLGLWWWSKNRPLPAAVVALTLFAATMAIHGLLAPASLTRGLILRLLVFSMLIRGIRAAIRYRNFCRERGRES